MTSPIHRIRAGASRAPGIALALCLACSLPVGAADPVVSNVVLTQPLDGSHTLGITYDLADADGDTLAVALQLSADGGASWGFPVLQATGDVGAAVVPGTGKLITVDLSHVAAGVVGGEFRAKVVASDAGVLFHAHSPRHIAVVDFANLDWSDPAVLESHARADFLAIMASWIWPGGDYGDVPVLDRIRALNPDIKIIGYVSVKSAQLWAAGSPPGFFWRDWLDRTRPYWAYTTEGDTVQDFPGNVVLNITDPECRRVEIETILDFHRAALNQLDGVYWDYFNNGLWIPDMVDVHGEPDLDGDGIPLGQDPDELAAYKNGCVDLVTALRDSLGEGFIQFFNGQRAYSDSTFAALSDGLMYELYPTLYYPRPELQNSLDPSYPCNLFAARNWVRDVNGGPYIVLSHPGASIYTDYLGVQQTVSTGDQYRAVALIADLYACWHEGQSTVHYTFGWPEVDVCLGEPLGPVVIQGSFLRREFQYGNVEIEMTTGRYPNPFDFRIWSQGELVSELDIPHHVP